MCVRLTVQSRRIVAPAQNAVLQFTKEFSAGLAPKLPQSGAESDLRALEACGRRYRIRIRSGSGSETDVFLADGTERVAVLSCAVEPGNLVTAHLLSIGATLAGEESSASSYWTLKGVLYFDPRKAINKLRPRDSGRSRRICSMPRR
jgi:hypothetical protein